MLKLRTPGTKIISRGASSWQGRPRQESLSGAEVALKEVYAAHAKRMRAESSVQSTRGPRIGSISSVSSVTTDL